MKQTEKHITPFERLTEFTRRIVAVPKSEVDKKIQALHRRKKQSRRPKTPRS